MFNLSQSLARKIPKVSIYRVAGDALSISWPFEVAE